MKHPLKFNMADYEKWRKTLRIDKSLDEKYKGVVLFPEKFEKTRELYNKSKLPE